MQTITPEAIDITTLPFTKFGKWYKLPEIAAIYFCLDSEGQVLYIGQSINLKYRWSIGSHDKRADCAELGAVKLAWLEIVNGASQRSALYAMEAKMISRFSPVLNMPSGIQAYEERRNRRQKIAEMKQATAAQSDHTHYPITEIGGTNIMYSEEISPEDKAKAEYELALYKVGKKAAEVVEEQLDQNSPNVLPPGKTVRVNVALRLLAIIQGTALPPE